jgi:hypothetical protein
MPASNASIHHNIFQNLQSTSVWSDASGIQPSEHDWDFYSNIVFADNTFTQTTGVAGGVIHFNGTNTFSGTLRFYNNTIANLGSVQSAQMVTWNNGSGTVAVQNNLSCNGSAASTGTVGTQDYNTYACNDTGATGSHDQSLSANPFANAFPSTLGANWDASLSAAGEASINAGLSLSSPYNLSCDTSNGWCVNGNATLTRGANGKWDRGALQKPSASTLTPPGQPYLK